MLHQMYSDQGNVLVEDYGGGRLISLMIVKLSVLMFSGDWMVGS